MDEENSNVRVSGRRVSEFLCFDYATPVLLKPLSWLDYTSTNMSLIDTGHGTVTVFFGLSDMYILMSVGLMNYLFSMTCLVSLSDIRQPMITLETTGKATSRSWPSGRTVHSLRILPFTSY